MLSVYSTSTIDKSLFVLGKVKSSSYGYEPQKSKMLHLYRSISTISTIGILLVACLYIGRIRLTSRITQQLPSARCRFQLRPTYIYRSHVTSRSRRQLPRRPSMRKLTVYTRRKHFTNRTRRQLLGVHRCCHQTFIDIGRRYKSRLGRRR